MHLLMCCGGSSILANGKKISMPSCEDADVFLLGELEENYNKIKRPPEGGFIECCVWVFGDEETPSHCLIVWTRIFVRVPAARPRPNRW